VRKALEESHLLRGSTPVQGATLTEGVAGNACELEIGILEHFLNPAGNTRMLLRQTGSCPGEIP